VEHGLEVKFELPLEVKAWDCHVHMSGSETPDSILKATEAAGLEGMIAFAPYPGLMTGHVMNRDEFRNSVEFASKIQRELDDKLAVFVFFEPRISRDQQELVRLLEWALVDKELRGVKMIPAEWFPSESFMDPIYRKIEEVGAPILFHCGISWGFPYSSKFCRPVEYEYLVKFPGIRFAIAHICWPWVDEALALAGKFLFAVARGNYSKCRVFIDITPGTPPLWRADALRKALIYLGPRLLMYGSDCFGADNANCFAQHIVMDLKVLKGMLGADEKTLELIFRENVLRFLRRQS